uniref:Uncharacterized protein n=1 Tax=Anguilla anguilla TaxID=7936 RepID=A0A0E9UZK8_ANGAN
MEDTAPKYTPVVLQHL